MNTILQKRIEEAAKRYCRDKNYILPDDTELSLEALTAIDAYIEAAKFILQNQWISVEEALPTEDRILALLSKNFCGKDNCYEILHRIAKEYIDLRHPDGYYDLCGENVPTSAITHWMPIPSLKGGEE